MQGRHSLVAILLSVLRLTGRTIAASTCNEDVTITSAADAKDLTRRCSTLNGDLSIAADVTETLDFDGLERVSGDILWQGCQEDCPTSQPFGLSSSTLTAVDGNIDFYYAPGLGKISFPNLATVNGSVLLKRLHDVTHIDLTSLQLVGFLLFETSSLEELDIKRIRGFTDPDTGGIEFWDAGKLESLDGVYSEPLDAQSRPDLTADGSSIQLNQVSAPDLRTLTIGWEQVSKVVVGSGSDLSLVLGGTETKSMNITEFSVENGVVEMERASGLQTLNVSSFTVSNRNITDLSIPFDHVGTIDIFDCGSLRTIALPEQAKSWSGLSLSIVNNGLLALDAATWTWPEEDMESVRLTANLTTDFFAPLVSGTAAVTNTFAIVDTGDQLDCSVFDAMSSGGRLPANFTCSSSSEGGGESAGHVAFALPPPLHVLTAVMAAATAGWLL